MTTDKSKVLTASIRLLNEKLHFAGNAGDNETISIDYTPPLGDNLGYTSLELLLLSLSSCAGSAILVVLRKMNKDIKSFEITSSGYRKQDHPTGFREINLEINLKAEEVTPEDLEKAIKRIEGICPVLSMLRGDVAVNFKFRINE
jgi:putative redox protein